MRSAVVIIATILLTSCSRDRGVLPAPQPVPATLQVPGKFPVPVIPAENPLTEEGIALGRMLYHDDILSSNGRSCSSCHSRERSYSTPLFVTATGERKSVPPHINLAWNPDYNWNGGEKKLDLLCLGDFAPEFFNTDMIELVRRLKAHEEYPARFFGAFGVKDVGEISHEELQLKIVYAISQFMRTMISSDSRFDRWVRKEITFTESEMRGFEIFFSEKGDCFHCHGYPLMTDNLFHNNGLDAVPAGPDRGRYIITLDAGDKGKFSSPTLRNIALTAPYMHDGRFGTLEEVVEFYDSGVNLNSPNLDPLMTKLNKKYGLGLTPQQKSDLVNFLYTLTDSSFIAPGRFGP